MEACNRMEVIGMVDRMEVAIRDRIEVVVWYGNWMEVAIGMTETIIVTVREIFTCFRSFTRGRVNCRMAVSENLNTSNAI
ncbi:hypothetical protein EVAR_41298_1 [Eumeta japonica]|uniref:Uncharacterized protein n=1 Tax=Eumeta variegata TaxID=151549 RepID=A0A4C1X884_EUMVA|nr:hypothetical protein EVAR_41298_1 [Eumeta japonica]